MEMNSARGLKGHIVFHALVCAAIFGLLTVLAIFSSSIHHGFFGYIWMFLAGTIFTTIGVAVGDGLRRMAMPDAYFTNGFADSIKKKIFWSIGPQAIGWFIGMVATQGFMQNYLGYDMQNGRPMKETVQKYNEAVAQAALAQGLKATPSSVKVPEPQVAPTAAPAADVTPKLFKVFESKECVMLAHKQTPQGLEQLRPVPVYERADQIAANGEFTKNFSVFYALDQDPKNGRVMLMYAPGFSGEERHAGQLAGWVSPDDLVAQEPRNCQ